ncbi:tripartite motif-containing protein 54-like [Delphinus delphis]|uniref:tripartite motif-containing protein 54-like n=1 Tax=Delphinus delphis TaxID=9728 RepID=UPI00375348EF
MEALGAVLSCPVCMELFTPAVLLLSCSHNFCKQCLELILMCQNCTHGNGQFCCPVCRKVIYLRGRGTNGLQRNILAENILEKFKEELEMLHTKEHNQLAQTCEKHGESVNLMCLRDEEPICGICKLFGDHESHPVAKISDAYAERKVSFAKDIQLVLQKSESAAQAVQDTKKFIRELSTSAADTLAMIATIGDSLLRGIKCQIATLKRQLESEHSSKLEKLQLVARELEAPQQIYQQMKMLLQHHANAVQFLHEHKRLRKEMVRLMEGSMSPQIPIKDTISIRRYFKELIRGIDITAFVPPETDQVLASTAGLREAWQAGCATQGRLSQQVLEDILCKAAQQHFLALTQESRRPLDSRAVRVGEIWGGTGQTSTSKINALLVLRAKTWAH